eukprot:4401367-Lingulodinium_polyedra.AAC.1
MENIAPLSAEQAQSTLAGLRERHRSNLHKGLSHRKAERPAVRLPGPRCQRFYLPAGAAPGPACVIVDGEGLGGDDDLAPLEG